MLQLDKYDIHELRMLVYRDIAKLEDICKSKFDDTNALSLLLEDRRKLYKKLKDNDVIE